MLKIACASGHTASGKGYGSVSGKYKESEIARAINKVVMKELKKKGHKVVDCTIDIAKSQNAYLQEQVKLVNESGAEYFLCIHLNASKTHLGKGSEIYTWNKRQDDVAIGILDNLEDLGFKNRGIKQGNDYYVVKKTKPKTLLIEVFFLDNKTDQKLYDKLKAEKIGKAIANAI